jgi:trans-aconitate methyltransferase
MTEWDAKGYSERSALQRWLAAEHLGMLELDGSERVLDIGCGDGWITAGIARRLESGSALGIDASTRMIDFAKGQFTEPEYPNLAFAVADAAALPFRREFDLVVSFNALHWVPDQNAVLRGIREALKPTGRAFLEFVPQGPRKCLEDVIEETCASKRWARYFAAHTPPYVHLTPDQYRRLATDHGFRVERLERELKAWDFGSRQWFVDWAKITFVPWTESLPKSRHLSFIDDVLDSYGRIDGRQGDAVAVFQFYQLEAVLRVV